MVKISVEVRSGAARFDVAVQAESIRQAVRLAEGRYSATDIRVIFPIDPGGFFVEDPFAKEGLAATGMPQEEKEVA